MKSWILAHPVISILLVFGIIAVIVFIINEIRCANYEEEPKSRDNKNNDIDTNANGGRIQGIDSQPNSNMDSFSDNSSRYSNSQNGIKVGGLGYGGFGDRNGRVSNVKG